MALDTTHYSQLYRDFLALDPANYHGLIRFYEAREAAVQHLNEQEYFIVQWHYTHALFKVKAYQQYLATVDDTLYLCLNQANPDDGQEASYFNDLLFMKAVAAQRNLQPGLAEHVLRELLRIQPDYPDAPKHLHQVLRQQDQRISRRTRAISILCFGLAAVVIAIEILFVRPFYRLHAEHIELLRNSIFLVGILLLSGGELHAWWKAHRQTQAFVEAQQSSSTSA